MAMPALGVNRLKKGALQGTTLFGNSAFFSQLVIKPSDIVMAICYVKYVKGIAFIRG